MKRLILKPVLVTMLLCCTMGAMYAQLSLGISPYSMDENVEERHPLPDPPNIELPPPDVEKFNTKNEKEIWPKVAVAMPADIGISNAGQWTDLPNGDQIWRLQLRAEGAKGLLLSFCEFQLPPEALLHVYDPEQTQVLGAFSNINNRDGGAFALGLLWGEAVILEYYHPSGAAQPQLHLAEVGYYILPKENEARMAGDLDINCPEGIPWQDAKHGVVRIQMKFSNGTWVNASGAIMNNTDEDETPYILTSYNLVLDQLENHNAYPVYEEFIFAFNWENVSCGGGPVSTDLSYMTGCAEKAHHIFSDHLLLELHQNIPVSLYKPYFLGWDWTNSTHDEYVSIHHPSSVKKLATDNTPAQLYPEPVYTSAYTYPSNNLLHLSWDKGETNIGSNGAPVLTNEGRVFGHITRPGGGCSGGQVFAGWLRKGWNDNSITPDNRLTTYLDPAGTNWTQFDGMYGDGPGCFSDDGPAERANAAVIGQMSKFVSSELSGNYKIVERAYINHRSEIQEALNSAHPKYAKVQSALDAFVAHARNNFFKAFAFGTENKVTDSGIATTRKLLLELKAVIPSKSFKKDVDKVLRLLHVGKGKDLKAALIAFDRANLDDSIHGQFEVGQAIGHTSFELQNTIGANTDMLARLATAGRLEMFLIDLNGHVVRKFPVSDLTAGEHRFSIDKVNLSAGIYMVQYKFDGLLENKHGALKMIVSQ